MIYPCLKCGYIFCCWRRNYCEDLDRYNRERNKTK